ncbi:MAG: hypothetical protein ACOX8U_03380 [Bradymonadia bacterium]|jgi:hypothetical protein
MMKITITQLIRALLFAIALLAFSQTAAALTVNDIINMASQNIGEDAIVQIILLSEAMEALNDEDLQRLRSAGLGDKTIEAIKSKQGAGKAELATSSDEISESAKDNVLRSYSEEPSREMGGELEQTTLESSHVVVEEREVSVEESVEENADDSPKRANGSNLTELHSLESFGLVQVAKSGNLSVLLEKFYESAYQSFLIHAEVQAKYDKLQEEHKISVMGTELLPELQRLQKRIPNDPLHALAGALRIESEHNLEADSMAHALLDAIVGLAANRLGLHHVAAQRLERAMWFSQPVHHFDELFLAYQESAKVSAHVLTDAEKIQNRQNFISDKHASSFIYAIAYSYVYGSHKDEEAAFELLSKNLGEGINAAKALLLTASRRILPPRNQFKTAALELEQATSILKNRKGDEAFQLLNIANLSLARIMHENSAHEQAHAFYGMLSPRSHHFKRARLEDAWTLYFGGRYPEAIAATQVFYIPDWEKDYVPELHIIEAAALLKLCQYDAATAALGRFKAKYLGSLQALQRFLASTKATDYVQQLLAFTRDSAATPLDSRMFSAILQDSRFYHAYMKSMHMRKEAETCRSLETRNTALKSLCDAYAADFTLAKSALEESIAVALDAVKAEILALDITATELSIEIQLALRAEQERCLQLTAQGMSCEVAKSVPEQPFFITENIQYWKFNSEFWRDELLSYYSRVPSLCSASAVKP